MARLKQFWRVLRETLTEFSEDNVMRLSAALAFYFMFSLAPAFILAMAIAGLLWGHEAAAGRLEQQIEHLVGPPAAATIQDIVDSSRRDKAGPRAALISIGTMFFGATIVVVALKESLNTIWGVAPDPRASWFWTIWNRLYSMVIILVVGLLLFLSMLLTTALSYLGGLAEELVPLPIPVETAYVVNWIVWLVVSTLLFATVFKLLPDARIQWNDVWIGAAITAVLFILGREMIALYLGRAGVATTYGAAGSLAALLIWVYYSSVIFFFGAELTQVNARSRGRRIEPAEGAVRVTEVLQERESARRRKLERQEAACQPGAPAPG